MFFVVIFKKWVEFGFVLDIKIAIAFLISQINQNILTTLVADLNTWEMHPSQFCSINVKRTLKFNKLTLASTYICLFHYPVTTLTEVYFNEMLTKEKNIILNIYLKTLKKLLKINHEKKTFQTAST